MDPKFFCDNCKTLFAHFFNKPRILKCGHILCSNCIFQFINENPICQKCQTPFGSLDTESFPVNSSLLNSASNYQTDVRKLIHRYSLELYEQIGTPVTDFKISSFDDDKFKEFFKKFCITHLVEIDCICIACCVFICQTCKIDYSVVCKISHSDIHIYLSINDCIDKLSKMLNYFIKKATKFNINLTKVIKKYEEHVDATNSELIINKLKLCELEELGGPLEVEECEERIARIEKLVKKCNSEDIGLLEDSKRETKSMIIFFHSKAENVFEERFRKDLDEQLKEIFGKWNGLCNNRDNLKFYKKKLDKCQPGHPMTPDNLKTGSPTFEWELLEKPGKNDGYNEEKQYGGNEGGDEVGNGGNEGGNGGNEGDGGAVGGAVDGAVGGVGDGDSDDSSDEDGEFYFKGILHHPIWKHGSSLI